MGRHSFAVRKLPGVFPSFLKTATMAPRNRRGTTGQVKLVSAAQTPCYQGSPEAFTKPVGTPYRHETFQVFLRRMARSTCYGVIQISTSNVGHKISFRKVMSVISLASALSPGKSGFAEPLLSPRVLSCYRSRLWRLVQPYRRHHRLFRRRQCLRAHSTRHYVHHMSPEVSLQWLMPGAPACLLHRPSSGRVRQFRNITGEAEWA